MNAGIGGRIERASRSVRAERFLARAPRYALIGACLVLCTLGLRDLLGGPGGERTSLGRGTVRDVAAEGFALEFARAYLSFDAGDPARRDAALAALVPEHLGEDAGFTPARGRQEVLSVSVAQNQEALAGGRIVTVSARTDGSPVPIYLAVPVRRTRAGSLVLAGYPSFVGPPAIETAGEEPVHEPVAEQGLAEMAHRVVANYISRSAVNLRADLSRDASVSLPTSPLRVVAPGEVTWAGQSREAVLASIEAADAAGNSYSLAYELGVAEQGGRWYATWVEVVPDAP